MGTLPAMIPANPDLGGKCSENTGLVWFFWKEFHTLLSYLPTHHSSTPLISGTCLHVAPGEKEEKEIVCGLSPGAEY